MKSRIMMAVMMASLGFLSFGPWTAIAQPQSSDTMEIVREKLRADKKFFVSQNIGLTDTETGSFWPIYDSYQQELAKLGDRQVNLIRDFAKNYESMSNETAWNLLDEYLSIDAARLQLRQIYLPKFREVLPPKKVVRYYQLEQKIHAVVQYGLAANIPLLQ